MLTTEENRQKIHSKKQGDLGKYRDLSHMTINAKLSTLESKKGDEINLL